MESASHLALLLTTYYNLLAPWVLGALLPSVITGLSLFPQTKGWAANLKKALDFLSFLTHKDSPDSVKRPFKASAPPAPKAPKLKRVK